MEYVHNNTPAGVVNREPANLNSVLVLDRPHKLVTFGVSTFCNRTESRAYSEQGRKMETKIYSLGLHQQPLPAFRQHIGPGRSDEYPEKSRAYSR